MLTLRDGRCTLCEGQLVQILHEQYISQMKWNVGASHGWKAQWGSTTTVRNKVSSVSLSVSIVYLYCIWKWIEFWCHTICCGPPQAIGSFLHNKIDDSIGDFPFCWGLGAWCAWISLCLYMFLCHVQKYVIPLVSYWINMSLNLPFYHLPLDVRGS